MTLSQRIRRLALGLAAAAAVAVAAAPAIAADHAVSIVNLTYEPSTITVAPGDTVVWTVTQSVGQAHSVTSGRSGEPNVGSAFDSGVDGLTNDGETYSHAFPDAGVYDYFCTVHGAAMSGQVIVQAPGEPAPSAEPPPSEVHTGVSTETKLTAGAILFGSIVLMFGLAFVWRRMNPA